ncbi:MAG: ABC transporter ATP-binding protein [Candidatus Heimdallarchaeota archaeon]|nr:ABC transporter ATP-binding protein [Candidatus Heimdallarchaeota archaeon]
MHVLKHLLIYIGQRKQLALSVILFISIAQIAELLIPLFIGGTIDEILFSIEENLFKTALVFSGVLLIVVASLIRGLTYFIARYMGYLQGEQIIYEIRKNLFEKYETASLTFFDEHHTGDLMARATTDLEPISEFLVWGERILVQASLTYIGIYLVLFLIDVRLFIFIGIVTPTLFILSYFVSTKLGPLYFDIRQQYGQLTTVIQENVTGTQIVKAFNAEEREKRKFDQENLGYMNLRAYAFKIRSIFLPMILLIVSLLITILIYAGGSLVIDGSISPGFLITLFTYFTMLAMPTRFLAFSLIMYQRVSAAGERVFKLLESKTELPTASNPHILDQNRPFTIRFENVSFRYNEKEVLSNISLQINPGEKVAILGPTGSGKTTLINLIPRFYDVSKGRITIDGVDVRDLQLNSLRKAIGFVHQDVFLFGRTIAENITFSVTEVDEAIIQDVVNVAQLREFIDSLAEGVNTIVGERGVTLSGGQKQRVAIARMLLKDSPLMILDDATSSLDIVTESQFQSAFKQYLDRSDIKSTVIFVTQRLSTLKIVDRIIILSQGHIIEQGNHDTLIKTGKIYPLLWKTQEAGILDIKLALERIAQDKEGYIV